MAARKNNKNNPKPQPEAPTAVVPEVVTAPETTAVNAVPQGLGDAPAPRSVGGPKRTELSGGIIAEDY